MIKELDKKYDPSSVEDRLYSFWCENGYFTPTIDKSKKPFTIVIPPPNVTGQLHMGHALDETLQDILIRYKRMQGYSTLWVPGTDHAGIATQIKVEETLRKNENLTRYDLGREFGIGSINTETVSSTSSKSSARLVTGRESVLRWTRDARRRYARCS